MPERTAIIGLDGATRRVLDPLAAAGVIPNLTRLRERGAVRTLRSTVPAYTPPAWMSMVTGVNPGRHNVFGFLSSTPQEAPKIAHSGTLGATPIWRHLEELGVPSGMFHIPMTFPPPAIRDGFMVAGGLAAGWTDPSVPRFASDPETIAVVQGATKGVYPLDSVVDYERDWGSVATPRRLESIQVQRRRALGALLDRYDPSFLFGVFEGPDRLHHIHYQYLVEDSDWFTRPEAARIRDADWEYFRVMDDTIGDIVAWCGDDGNVVVVSDHGAGPWEKTINVNRLLADWGYLKLPVVGRVVGSGVVSGPAQRLARRVVPRSWLQAAKAKVNRGIEWHATSAFASQVAEQGIHINRRATMPQGTLDVYDAERVAIEIEERLRELVDPDDGLPVVDAVLRRRDVIHGPYEDRSPDLFLFCRDQRYELSDTLAAKTVFTDHRDRPWGYHHNDGVWISAGPAFARGFDPVAMDIVDVLPTVFAAAGLEIPEGLDGSVVGDVLAPERIAAGVVGDRKWHPPVQPVQEDAATPYPFTSEDEATIEASLRGLGYLE